MDVNNTFSEVWNAVAENAVAVALVSAVAVPAVAWLAWRGMRHMLGCKVYPMVTMEMVAGRAKAYLLAHDGAEGVYVTVMGREEVSRNMPRVRMPREAAYMVLLTDTDGKEIRKVVEAICAAEVEASLRPEVCKDGLVFNR